MGNTQPTPSSGAGSSSMIDDQVAEHCVFIYSATYCSYCTKAKNLLNDINAQYGAVELDKLNSKESGQVFSNLVSKTNVRTVPQVFINGKFIGGYSELVKLQQTQQLMEKLSQCNKPCLSKE